MNKLWDKLGSHNLSLLLTVFIMVDTSIRYKNMLILIMYMMLINIYYQNKDLKSKEDSFVYHFIGVAILITFIYLMVRELIPQIPNY